MNLFRNLQFTKEILEISRHMKASRQDRRDWALRTGKDFGLGPINLWRLSWALRKSL